MRCTKCGRTLRNPVMLDGAAFGRVCASKERPATKAKRVRLFTVKAPKEGVKDIRQGDLFAQEVRP